MADETERAARVLNLFVAGDFETAAQCFDETLGLMMPAPAMKGAWEQIVSQAGPLERVLTSVDEQDGGRTVTYLRCQFEHGVLICRMIWRDDERLMGLHFYRPDQGHAPD